MKKTILTSLVVLLCANSIIGETPTSIYNQLGISYSNVGLNQSDELDESHYNVQLEYIHDLNKHFAIGAYLGYGFYREYLVERGVTDGYRFFRSSSYSSASSAHYGINGIAHLLPIFDIKSAYHDVYVNGRMGMISMFTKMEGENIVPQRGHYFNYSLVGGYTFYAWQHVGFFVEYGYNISKYTQKTSVRFGLKFDL